MTSLRVAHASACHAQQRRDAVEQARRGIDRNEQRFHADAHQACGFGVVAQRIDVAADGGFAQGNPGHEVKRQHEHGAVGDRCAADAERIAQRGQGIRQSGYGLRLGINLRDCKCDVERSQCDDERRQAHQRNERAVQQAERRAHSDT